MRRHLISLLALGTVASSACGGESGATARRDVTVRLTDYAIEAPESVPAGTTTFAVANGSPSVRHEFVVIRTDLPIAQLPLDEVGAFDERGRGLAFIDEKERIEPSTSTALTVDLTPGRYVLLCNLDDHFRRDMVRELTVR